MEKLHSSPSSPRVSPEGIPEGLTRSDSGILESELSQFNRLERNTANLLAAAAAGIPASAVLQKPQTAAADSGILESAVLQTQPQPMDGVTDSSVPPEMSHIQEEPERYSTADSESDSSEQNWRFQSVNVREKRKKERWLARKASQVKGTDSSTAVEAMQPPNKPLLKVDVTKNSRTYIWNSGSKKAQFPKNVTPPKIMSIEGVNIYLQILTSDEARNCRIMGWDAVLADSKTLLSWNCWMQKSLSSGLDGVTIVWWPEGTKLKLPKLPPSKPQIQQQWLLDLPTTLTPLVVKMLQNGNTTGTPGSSEPPSKKSLTTGGSYSQAAGGSPPLLPPKLSGVHSNDVDKGPIEKDIFFEIVSQCNIIKNQGAISGEPEFCWKSNLIRQPSYDAENSRGKIVCGDQTNTWLLGQIHPDCCNHCMQSKLQSVDMEGVRDPKDQILLPDPSWHMQRTGCQAFDPRHVRCKPTQYEWCVHMSHLIWPKPHNSESVTLKLQTHWHRAIDDAERVLVGPVCPLHFKLQSGDPEDPGPDPVCPEIQANQTDDVSQLLDLNSVEENANEGNLWRGLQQPSGQVVLTHSVRLTLALAAALTLQKLSKLSNLSILSTPVLKSWPSPRVASHNLFHLLPLHHQPQNLLP